MLTKKETLELADRLVDNIQTPPPGHAMFAAATAAKSEKALAKYHFEEALLLSIRHEVSAAIKNEIPQQYGKAALSMQSAREFMRTLGDKILVDAVDAKSVVDAVQKDNAPAKLTKLKRINSVKAVDSVLKLPATHTELSVDATNFGVRGKNQTTYTWRKVYGAGKVSFTPNASPESKMTTLSFTDKKPGKYRFEVTMSDTLSIDVVKKTVDVTLYDKQGKLPANRPPSAQSQTVTAVPGSPKTIHLSATDPDGDDLGFEVIKQPAHGRLAGVDGNLTYTADYGFTGTDQLTFDAMDGQGLIAKGVVTLKVSDKDVDVAVYDGFNYPEGHLSGCQGGGSFGFAGPWTNTRGANGHPYKVLRSPVTYPNNTDGASLSLPGLPSSGGRVKGWWGQSYTRALDTKVLSENKLLENGRELWFSFFMDHPHVGFSLEGSSVSINFLAVKHHVQVTASINNESGIARNPWSRSAKVRFPDTHASMIVGHCTWGKTDKDKDKLEIYRVFDSPAFGPMLDDKPVCVVEEAAPQQNINSLKLVVDTISSFDELRIGPTLHSVMVGTKPLGEAKTP